jgi:hypothetical protein
MRGSNYSLRSTQPAIATIPDALSANRKLCFWSQNHFTLIPTSPTEGQALISGPELQSLPRVRADLAHFEIILKLFQ